MISILLAEDNSHDEALTSRALSKIGGDIGIQVVRDGVEALDFIFGPEADEADEAQHTVDLVILDIKMPKLNGFEVLERLRANRWTRFWPVVMLTSSDEPGDILRSYQLGANSYVRKPVNFEEYQKTVADLGTYWVHINTIPEDQPLGR